MKKALIISVSFNVIIILFIAGKRYYYSHPPAPSVSQVNTYDIWNETRNSLLSNLPIDSNDIVFVGNSLTEGFPVAEIFGSHVKNRGIGGNRTYHIIQRMNKILNSHTKKIFIEAGINDLRDGVSVDSVFKNYRQIIDFIRDTSPKTFIYVQSVFPTSGEYAKFNIAVAELNKLLTDYCAEIGVKYVDIYSMLLQNGQLNDRFTDDGLHLNGKGYRIWEKAVETYVK